MIQYFMSGHYFLDIRYVGIIFSSKKTIFKQVPWVYGISPVRGGGPARPLSRLMGTTRTFIHKIIHNSWAQINGENPQKSLKKNPQAFTACINYLMSESKICENFLKKIIFAYF